MKIETEASQLNINNVKQLIIDYTNWLCNQNLMISEDFEGYSLRSTTIGGKKYSAAELYDKFISQR